VITHYTSGKSDSDIALLPIYKNHKTVKELVDYASIVLSSQIINYRKLTYNIIIMIMSLFQQLA